MKDRSFNILCIAILVLTFFFAVVGFDYSNTKTRQQDLIKVIESNKAVIDEYQERVIELEITVYGLDTKQTEAYK